MKTIPDANRSEWREVLTGALEVTLNSYLMKMMLSQAKEQLQEKNISLDDAVIDFHARCLRFSNTEGVLADVNLIFNKKKQQENKVIKQEKKEQLNFEIEDLSVANTLIKEEKTQLVSKKKEILTPIENIKKPNQEQVPAKLKPTIPINSNNKELNVVNKDVISTKSTIADARLKVAKERIAFEKTLEQENVLKKPKTENTSTVSKLEKIPVDKKSMLVKEKSVIKTELKTKTSGKSLSSYTDKPKKDIHKESFFEKISTIFFSEE